MQGAIGLAIRRLCAHPCESRWLYPRWLVWVVVPCLQMG